MIEAFGNIWDNVDNYDAVVITTNGFVKKNGEAVMGRGIALEAKKRYPNLPARLGYWLKEMGNVPGIWTYGTWSKPLALITWPVKPEYGPNGQPGWRVRADIELIENSIEILLKHVTDYELEKIVTPRPGCGNGGLKWEQVKPVIEPYLDDRFTVMERL